MKILVDEKFLEDLCLSAADGITAWTLLNSDCYSRVKHWRELCSLLWIDSKSIEKHVIGQDAASMRSCYYETEKAIRSRPKYCHACERPIQNGDAVCVWCEAEIDCPQFGYDEARKEDESCHYMTAKIQDINKSRGF